MDIKNIIEELGLTLKWKAQTNGGEYSSPCPFCGGDDRFIISPSKENQNGRYMGGRFFCRQCGKYGDAVKLLELLHGFKFKEACERLKLEPLNFLSAKTIKQDKGLVKAENPCNVWQEKAKEFVTRSHENLMNDKNALAEFTNRGFTTDSITRFKLGFNPNDFWNSREEWGLPIEKKGDGHFRKLWLAEGLVIPTFFKNDVIKINIRRSKWFDGDKFPKYAEVSGSKKCPSIYGNVGLETAIIIEGEIDGLIIQQEASDLVFSICLGGSTKKFDFNTDLILQTTERLLFCPDYDKAGVKSWEKWKKTYPSLEKILTPFGKDSNEALLEGYDLKHWITSHMNKNKD